MYFWSHSESKGKRVTYQIPGGITHGGHTQIEGGKKGQRSSKIKERGGLKRGESWSPQGKGDLMAIGLTITPLN